MLLMLRAALPALKVSDSALPPVVPTVLLVTVNTPLFVVNATVAASAMVKLPPTVKVAAEVFVAILFAALTLPLVEKLPPVTLMPAADPSVKVPELVTAKPPAVVVKPFCIENAVPRNTAEPVVALPVKVVAPVAALVCVRAPEILTAPKVAAAEFVIVTLVKPVASADVPEP